MPVQRCVLYHILCFMSIPTTTSCGLERTLEYLNDVRAVRHLPVNKQGQSVRDIIVLVLPGDGVGTQLRHRQLVLFRVPVRFLVEEQNVRLRRPGGGVDARFLVRLRPLGGDGGHAAQFLHPLLDILREDRTATVRLKAAHPYFTNDK